MSKALRLERLRHSLAKKNSNWEQYNEDMAFNIFIIEKEFNVGLITDKFPLTKFWNLLDKTNVERYNEMMKPKSDNSAKTFK